MIQRIAQILGDEACFLFCILKPYGRHAQALALYDTFVKAGWILPDCYITAKGYSGIPDFCEPGWTHALAKEPLDYIAAPGEIEIVRYERATTSKTYGHFVLMEDGKIWDPLGDSTTVRLGRPVSKRIIRRTGRI